MVFLCILQIQSCVQVWLPERGQVPRISILGCFSLGSAKPQLLCPSASDTKNVLPDIAMFQQMKCINCLDPDPLHTPGLLFCEQSANSLNSSSEEPMLREKNTKQPQSCSVTATEYSQEESQNGNSGKIPQQSFSNSVKAFSKYTVEFSVQFHVTISRNASGNTLTT